jgi:hypothetical protein
VGRACSTQGRDEKRVLQFWSAIVEERTNLEDDEDVDRIELVAGSRELGNKLSGSLRR